MMDCSNPHVPGYYGVMYKKNFIRLASHLLLLSLFSCTVSSNTHAQTNLSREEVVATGQWLDARETVFSGDPILLHLRTGYERALLMPEPVRLSETDHQSSDYQADIDGDVVRFYPLRHFDRQLIRLTGLDTATEYVLRVRASAYGIRQPLQVFLADWISQLSGTGTYR